MYAGQQFALLVMCAAFVASGCVMAALGPALPDLARQTNHTLAELGSIFAAIFGGGLLAQLLGGPISDRFGRRVVLVWSAVSFGTATFAMSVSTRLPLMLAAACVLGFGYGGSTLSVNVLASELTPHRRAATLNLVNVFYAIGAIAGPLLAGRAIVWWGTAQPALWAGAALMVLVAPGALAALPALHSTATSSALAQTAKSDAARSASGSGRRALTPVLPPAFMWSAGLLILLYVGSEASLGGWTAVYLAHSVGVDSARAATITSMFWLSLCIGRLLATVAGFHLTAERLLLISIVTALVGASLLLAGHGWLWLTVIALGLLGLSFGPIYPTMAAIVTARAPHMAGTAMSRMGVLASIGGMALPWLYGLLLTDVGTVAAPAQTLVMAIGMAGMWALLHRLEAPAA
jgi:FHS family glucose/mannose:H+ symporter-like MFS transporter